MSRAPQPRWPEPANPIGRIHLAFAPPRAGAGPPRHDLSAIARAGGTLFIGADESAHVELLHALPGGGWGDHERCALAGLFTLPDDADELDVEGLAVDAGLLWIVGSHSRTRGKLKAGAPATPESFARMARLSDNPNRAFLGCVALADLGGGRFGLAAAGARMLSIRKGEDALKRRLAAGPVLAPFLAIPAKENGVDVEGLAVDGARVCVGLRGPVIGGWACLIDLTLREGGALGLKIDGEIVRHWVDLDGLGVRDLQRDGDDLLILAGPAMAVSGPAAVYRWRGWRKATSSPSVQTPEQLFALPTGYRCDHPEALLPWRNASGAGLLVLADNPHPSRLTKNGLDADLFALR